MLRTGLAFFDPGARIQDPSLFPTKKAKSISLGWLMPRNKCTSCWLGTMTSAIDKFGPPATFFGAPS